MSECTSGVSPVIYRINTNLVLPDFEMKRDGTALASAATYIYLDLLGRYPKEHRADPGKGY